MTKIMQPTLNTTLRKSDQKRLILASSSPYRKSLLERLQIPFSCHSPNIDETVLDNESPKSLVKRLSIAKAQAVQLEILKTIHFTNNDDTINNDSLATNKVIIASDQIAVLNKHTALNKQSNQRILGKPLNYENAIQQLKDFSGKKVSFLTGLCVLDLQENTLQYELSEYHVYFRELTTTEIENYICIEQPLNCAGSFKCEGLGISLFEKMEGEDSNSLIGLPLISLCRLLRKYGINPIS